MISWILVTILALGYPVLWLERRRHTKRVFETGTRHLSEQVGELRHLLDDERAQKGRFQAKNSEISDERDGWIKLYHDQAIGHGNAQNLMMEVIDRLGAQLSSRGIKIKIPSVISLMREEFMQKHELPSREAMELLKKAEEAAKDSKALVSSS